MALFSIIVDIAARTADIEQSLSRVEERLGSFGRAVGKVGELFAIGKLAEFTEHILAMGAQLEHTAARVGIGVEALQTLNYAAKQSGISADELQTALIRMNRAMSLASTGGKQQTETLRALGLTYDQLKNLKPEEQFELLADRISKLPSAADKARAEIVLFGRAGGELGSLFEHGAAGILKARQEAEKLGLVMDEHTTKQLEEAHKAIDRLEQSLTILAGTIIGKISPALTGMANSILAVVSGDSTAKLKADIDFLNRMGEEEGYFAVGSNPNLGGWGYHSARDARARAAALQAQLNLQQSALRPEDLASPDLAGLLGGAAPGFAGTQEPDLFVHVKGTIAKERTGLYALLDQWDHETSLIENRAEEEYQQTKLKLESLRNTLIEDPKTGKAVPLIDDEEFQRRMALAASKFNATFDQLQPVQINVKKIIDLPPIEQALRQLTADIKGALNTSLHEQGNFGKNLLRNILTALEDRAIYQAIDQIGVYLSNTLHAATAAGAGGNGNWLGLLISTLFGTATSGGFSGGSAGGAGASGGGFGGARAGGGPVMSDRTYLVGEHGPELFTPSGSGSITPNNKLGGAPVFNISYNIVAPNGDQQLRAALPGLLAQTAARTKADMLEAWRRNSLPAPRSA